MKDLSKITQLFDVYGNLLSNKQRSYIVDYYFNDLSLSEIATKYNISRAAIHYSINEGINELNLYEDKLQFLYLQKKRLNIYEKLQDLELKQELINLELINKNKF